MRFALVIFGVLMLVVAGVNRLAAPERQGWSQWPAVLAESQQREQADWLVRNKPSEYPWLRQLGQLWSAGGRSAFEARGLSADMSMKFVADSAGTALRGAYELTVGRLGELTRQQGMTAEEQLAARVAQQAADAERLGAHFSHAKALSELWCDTPWTGADMPRKWERRYVLTTEYAARALVDRLIDLKDGVLARVRGEPVSPEVDVMVDRWIDRVSGNFPEIHRIRSFETGGELVRVPDGKSFTPSLLAIARDGAAFVAVGSQTAKTPVLIALQVPQGQGVSGEELTRLRLATQPRDRVLVRVPPQMLAEALRAVRGDVRLEAVIR